MPATAAATAASIVSEPTDSGEVGERDTRVKIDGLAERLRATFRTGRTLDIAWRKQQLQALLRLLQENTGSFEETLAADLGKPGLEAFIADIGMPIGEAKLALKNIDKWTRHRKVPTPSTAGPGKSYLKYDPLGVVLIISPWNYPVQLCFNPLVAAIAAGNTAVIKPSEMNPKTSALIAELVPQYLDAEAFVVVEGAVDETTRLLEQRWDHILYTGNGMVGRIVMAAAAKHLTPVTLELGGKSPCIVMPDADLMQAARRIAYGKWVNAGQTCTAPDYILVHKDVETEFIDNLKSVLKEFYGEDPKASKDFARIIAERHVDRLAALIRDDGDDKVEIAVGGQVDRDDRYVAPTIVRSVTPQSKVMQSEIFGPILPVIAVDDVDAAIDLINDGDKPLALYVFTKNKETSDKVLARTSSGGVTVNGTLFHLANPNLPFGGVGESGMGSYHGEWGFLGLSHRKAVLEKATFMDPKIAYPPYTGFKNWVLRKFM
ncbi:MAG: aldehyde dehydrogenase (NAD+) [Hyphomicrobiaceae bacterium]|jgi:aldehyde dehydrogenase (NAD+)